MSDELYQFVCDMALSAPQKTIIGDLAAVGDPSVWTPDPIVVPFQLLLAKQPSWTDEYKRFVMQLAPQADYRVYDGPGHFIHMEEPAEINKAIAEFLE
ncbi:MAG: hypothetical protein HY286_04615 [Planctomycetes bacterium]|nr:hypothetical protein [Planctomycetota bacterium]